MGAVVASVIIGVVIIALVLGYLVVHRRELGEPPRRRELRLIRAERDAARGTLTEVRHLVDLYYQQLDLVGATFADHVRDAIRKHDQQILDPRKKEDQ